MPHGLHHVFFTVMIMSSDPFQLVNGCRTELDIENLPLWPQIIAEMMLTQNLSQPHPLLPLLRTTATAAAVAYQRKAAAAMSIQMRYTNSRHSQHTGGIHDLIH